MEWDCKIWLIGRTDTEEYPWQSLSARDLKTAETKLRTLTAKGKDESIHRVPLSDCIQEFLDSHTGDVNKKTLTQHCLVLSRLEQYATRRTGEIGIRTAIGAQK